MNLYLLKETIRAYLLKLLGVEEIAKRAFTEGYNMHDDFKREKLLPIRTEGQLRVLVLHSRSVDEAWANSDTREMFE